MYAIKEIEMTARSEHNRTKSKTWYSPVTSILYTADSWNGDFGVSINSLLAAAKRYDKHQEVAPYRFIAVTKINGKFEFVQD